jgi:hypothetical protein
MKHDWILTVAAGAIMLMAYAGVTEAGERSASGATQAEKSANVKARSNRRPLEVNIYPLRRRGGYSYRASDVINTYGGSPPPYLDVRQTPGGPFDSGFFFDSGVRGPPFIGGQSPYLH